jgi:hypothetical protein
MKTYRPGSWNHGHQATVIASPVATASLLTASDQVAAVDSRTIGKISSTFWPLGSVSWVITGMSKSRPPPSRRLTCTDVRFVEVDFPRQLRSRLVIEFSEGLSLVHEDTSAIALAAEFVTTFRKHLAAKGGRPC